MSTMTLRWSAIKSWRRCQQMYFNRYIRQYERRKPAVPLIRGSIIGEMLDQLAAKKSILPVVTKYEKEYGKLFRAEKEEYGDIIPECQRIVENYKAAYKKDGLTYLKGSHGLPYELELVSEFTVDGTKVHFQGHIDKLVQDHQDLVLVMDHKTHKVIPDSNARFSDLQLLTYVWLLPRSDLEISADGVLWDYLRTKPPTVPELLKNGSLTLRKNLDSDYQTYLAEIKKHNLDPADYTETLERLKSESKGRYFDRVKLPAPAPAMIKQVVKEFKETIIQIREVSARGNFVRNMTKDCSWCGYYNLCSAEIRGIDTQFILKHDYVQIDGDPHHGTRTKIVKP